MEANDQLKRRIKMDFFIRFIEVWILKKKFVHLITNPGICEFISKCVKLLLHCCASIRVRFLHAPVVESRQVFAELAVIKIYMCQCRDRSFPYNPWVFLCKYA